MAKIPAEVWQFCVKQIKLYPLYEAQLREEYQLANAAYLYSGGDKSYDASGVLGGSYTTSPVAVALEIKQSALEQPYIKYLARCVERMQDATRGLEQVERDVLEAVWAYGWNNNELLGKKISVSAATVKRAKREIIERLAVRWGLWVA